MNFYKRYMGDFAKKTAHLNMTEQGAYDRMLDHYYAMQRALPNAYQALYHITKAMNTLERKAVARVADEFFPLNGDGFRHNKRADAEIARHEAQASKNREIGKLGGRPRKTESITESDIKSVSQSDSETEPNREPNGNPTRVAHGRAKPEASSKPKSKEAAAPPSDLWTEGAQVLSASGVSTESARTFIGRALKHWTADTVLDALREARGTADPKAYAIKLLQAKPKKPGAGSDPTAGAI